MISPLDKVLRTAIRKRRLIRLVYDGRDRIAEPHDYGIQDGAVRLLAYQVEPPAAWRLFSVSKITDCALLEDTFPGGRPTPTGKHHRWDQLFARVGQPNGGKPPSGKGPKRPAGNGRKRPSGNGRTR